MQVFDDRPQGQGREEAQRPHDDHDGDQQHDEQRRVRRQRAGAGGTIFFAASEPAIASTGSITQNRPTSIASPSRPL